MPLLYWTAMGWAGAMSLKVNDSDVSADQPIVEALARRALELDPCWGLGSIHEFFVSWEAGRSTIGGSVDRARDHFEKALACAQGRRAFPYVTYAESVSVAKQDKAQFQELMQQGPRDRRQPARRPAARQPPRPEARPLAARSPGRALHRVAERSREDS